MWNDDETCWNLRSIFFDVLFLFVKLIYSANNYDIVCET